MSLSKDAPIDSDSSGRSGATFQLSYDKRFVIKTICSEEIAEMHRILKTYHQVIIIVRKAFSAVSPGNKTCSRALCKAT